MLLGCWEIRLADGRLLNRTTCSAGHCKKWPLPVDRLVYMLPSLDFVPVTTVFVSQILVERRFGYSFQGQGPGYGARCHLVLRCRE